MLFSGICLYEDPTLNTRGISCCLVKTFSTFLRIEKVRKERSEISVLGFKQVPICLLLFCLFVYLCAVGSGMG